MYKKEYFVHCGNPAHADEKFLQSKTPHCRKHILAGSKNELEGWANSW